MILFFKAVVTTIVVVKNFKLEKNYYFIKYLLMIYFMLFLQIFQILIYLNFMMNFEFLNFTIFHLTY